MKMKALILILGLCFSWSAFAQDAEEGDVPMPGASEPAAAAPIVAEESKKPKRTAQKKEAADGTQAPNRFKEDPVIQSRYRAGGQPLEVDPD